MAMGKDISLAEKTEAQVVKTSLGEIIARRRIAAGFGQRPFSRVVGISNSHLRAIESGQVSPTVVTVHKICSVLECDMAILFAELDEALKKGFRQ